MGTVSMIVLSLAIVAGCGGKDEDTGQAAPSAGPSSTQPTPQGVRPTLAPVEPVAPLKSLPPGLPPACQQAEVTMRKIVTCNKIDHKTKVGMAKSWNGAVEGAYLDYANQPEKNKTRIATGCANMVENSKPLLDGCP